MLSSNLLDITGFFVGVLINLLLIAMICYYFKRKIDNLEFSQSEQAKTLYTLISESNPNSLASRGKAVELLENNIINNLDLTKLSDDNAEEDNNSESDEESDGESGGESDGESDEESDGENIIENSEEHEETIEKSVEELNNDSMLIESINIMAGIATVDSEEHVKQIDIRGENIIANELDDKDESEINMINYDNQEVSEITKKESENLENNIEDYEKMTVKELKGVLAERGVHAKSSMNKSDIINILKDSSLVGDL